MEQNTGKFIVFLQGNGVEITKLTPNQVDEFRQEWFTRVVPADKRKRAIESYCFDRDGCCGYLWHVFSYQILDCIEGNEARIAFDGALKKEMILLANWEDIASCKINNTSSITAESLDTLDDVILTDCKFKWTYVKTHELACGPYFHSIRRN